MAKAAVKAAPKTGSKPAPAPSRAVAKAKGTAVADPIAAFDTGSGFEHVTAKDLMIPRLLILEPLSPQLKKNKPEFIKGAEVGDFCDVSTGDIFKEQLHLVNCLFCTIYLEWQPDRGGLAANHGMDSSILKQTTQDEKRRNVLPNGNFIAETATFHVLNLSAGGRRSIIPLSSTRLKAARKWNSSILGIKLERADGSLFTPDPWYMTWIAKPVPQSNEQGDWHNWSFEPDVNILEYDPTGRLLADAREFYSQANAGLVQADFSKMAAEESGTERSDAM